MKLIAAGAACLAILGSTAVQASPSMGEPPSKRIEVKRTADPDFWYVVSDPDASGFPPTSVQGIVIPSSVEPTVQTTPTGSVLAWERADGTRQSFVIEGVRSFNFKAGPLGGTTYVPFRTRLRFEHESCCACASWNNMVESVEEFSCVPGCAGCGCEACICDRLPCSAASSGALRLVPHADVASSMTFDQSGRTHEIEFRASDRTAARFRGDRLTAKTTPKGGIVIENPDSIAIPAAATSRRLLRGDDAFYGWTAPGVSVIVEQAASLPAPSFRDGTIAFNDPLGPGVESRILAFDPDGYRCRICGVHPDSDGDLDRMVCIPGGSTCYRCVEFNCATPEL